MVVGSVCIVTLCCGHNTMLALATFATLHSLHPSSPGTSYSTVCSQCRQWIPGRNLHHSTDDMQTNLAMWLQGSNAGSHCSIEWLPQSTDLSACNLSIVATTQRYSPCQHWNSVSCNHCIGKLRCFTAGADDILGGTPHKADVHVLQDQERGRGAIGCSLVRVHFIKRLT
jgi:hypothetical protein